MYLSKDGLEKKKKKVKLRSVIYFLIVKKSKITIYNKHALGNNINTLVWYPTVTLYFNLIHAN
jgi:hypothetical protein